VLCLLDLNSRQNQDESEEAGYSRRKAPGWIQNNTLHLPINSDTRISGTSKQSKRAFERVSQRDELTQASSNGSMYE
jgi:hypothetical protein